MDFLDWSLRKFINQRPKSRTTMADFAKYELEIGNIDGKDAKLVLAIQLTKYLDAQLEMHQSVPGSQYQNFSRFRETGSIEKIVGEGSVYMMTDSDFVLSEPRLEINVDCAISYRLSGEGVPSVPMPKEDIMRVIAGQYNLAEKFLCGLKRSKIPPKHEVAKLVAEEMLEEIMKFDYTKYSGYEIKTF